jgi:hypothetical protein
MRLMAIVIASDYGVAQLKGEHHLDNSEGGYADCDCQTGA